MVIHYYTVISMVSSLSIVIYTLVISEQLRESEVDLVILFGMTIITYDCCNSDVVKWLPLELQGCNYINTHRLA